MGGSDGGLWFPAFCAFYDIHTKGAETVQGRELACVYWYQLASLPFLGAPDPSLSSWGLPAPGKEEQTPPRTRGPALRSLSGHALVRGEGLGRRGLCARSRRYAEH